MMRFACCIKHPFDVTVQCPHDADPNMVGPPSVATGIKASMGGLPFRNLMLGLQKLRDVIAGNPRRDQLALARQGGLRNASPSVRVLEVCG